MPSYDYYCEANQQTLEVRHGINDHLSTWGELCAKANIDPGATSTDNPVRRLITGGGVLSGARRETLATTAPTSCCARGNCGCG